MTKIAERLAALSKLTHSGSLHHAQSGNRACFPRTLAGREATGLVVPSGCPSHWWVHRCIAASSFLTRLGALCLSFDYVWRWNAFCCSLERQYEGAQWERAFQPLLFICGCQGLTRYDWERPWKHIRVNGARFTSYIRTEARKDGMGPQWSRFYADTNEGKERVCIIPQASSNKIYVWST